MGGKKKGRGFLQEIGRDAGQVWNKPADWLNKNYEKLEHGAADLTGFGIDETELTKGDEKKERQFMEQKTKADEEARVLMAKEIGVKSSGMASTILGGTLSDGTNLRKKKLLGE